MPRFTWRLTFAYKDDAIRLVSVEHVQMIAPAPATPPPTSGQSGHWVEVRSGRGDLLYHRALHDLVPQDHEVFTNEPGRTVHRVPLEKIEGEFQVLVPDWPGADRLSIHGPRPSQKRGTPSQVLAEATFEDLARLKSSR
ncbi:hypothetical protein WL77_32380 [Burkholderia ubonensis]|nr:hypothetical protein WL77_32380 [Burkholderia ubonensis]KWE77767.1 hypothetical protein WL79_06680 [Burkholderia ubonensis]